MHTVQAATKIFHNLQRNNSEGDANSLLLTPGGVLHYSTEVYSRIKHAAHSTTVQTNNYNNCIH
jgi:hypothetical protein